MVCKYSEYLECCVSLPCPQWALLFERGGLIHPRDIHSYGLAGGEAFRAPLMAPELCAAVSVVASHVNCRQWPVQHRSAWPCCALSAVLLPVFCQLRQCQWPVQHRSAWPCCALSAVLLPSSVNCGNANGQSSTGQPGPAVH